MAYVNSTAIAHKGILDRLAGLKSGLTAWVQKRRVYERTVAELNALGDRDLADLGISRLGIAEIAREAAYGK